MTTKLLSYGTIEERLLRMERALNFTEIILPATMGAGDDSTLSGPPSGAAGGDLAGTYPNPSVFQAHLTDQAAPAAPAAGTLILASFNQQGFSVPHIYDTQGDAIEIIRDNITVIRNNSGGSLTKGQAVYVTGSTGTVPTVALARANSTTTMPAIGIMYDTTVNNAFGRVMLLGHVENINLSAFLTGDQVYVDSAVAGGLTKTAPVAPNVQQFVGTVVNNGVGNGVLNVNISTEALNFNAILGSATAGQVPNHDSLNGLPGVDAHTQYLLLAGRAGGQNAKGGTAAADSLDLSSSTAGFVHGNAGRINLHERVVWPDNVTLTSSAALLFLSYAGTITCTGQAFIQPSGFKFNPIVSYDTGQVLSLAPAFWAAPDFSPTAAVTNTGTGFAGFVSAPRFRPNLAASTGATTADTLFGYFSQLTGSHAGSTTGNTGTVTLATDYIASNGALTIGTGITFTTWSRFYAQNPAAPTGTITNLIGLDQDIFTRGGNNLGVRAGSPIVQNSVLSASYTVQTNYNQAFVKRLQMTGTGRITVKGTARLRGN